MSYGIINTGLRERMHHKLQRVWYNI